MTDLWTYLKNSSKPIALYGSGNGADKILDKLVKDGVSERVAGVFVSDGFVRNKTYRGYRIESYDSIRERIGDMTVLVCFGSARPEVLANIDKIASEQELFVPDVPVYGKEIFDIAYYKEHEDDLGRVREMLSDDLSRRTFDDTIRYKLTGELSALRDCEVSADHADSLITLPDNSTFVDLGAYNGDTVLRYTSFFPQIKRVYAVEPDARNHRKLTDNTARLASTHELYLLHAAVGEQEGELLIPKNRGRGISPDAMPASEALSQGQDSRVTVPVVTVDGILAGSKADFIKFDVEGAEAAAIEGARQTISRYRPGMLLSCYHRSRDLFDLPLRIAGMRDDYKLYMRHLPCVPGWDTAFYYV